MPRPIDIDRVTPSDIAEFVGLPVDQLFAISSAISQHYHPTRIQVSEKGKTRELDVPKPYLKRILKLVHRFIQRHGWFSEAAHGGVKNRSSFSSAKQHLGKRAVSIRDVSDCYPSISMQAFHESLVKLGMQSDTARLLSKLLTCHNRVPQGAPTSGDALNLYLWRMDTQMLNRSVTYTRMADDHVLSGDSPALVEEAAEELEALLLQQGLTVNAEKRQKNGLQLLSGRQNVHSINVNHPTKTRIPKERDAQYRASTDEYVTLARSVSPDSLSRLAQLRRKLDGYINCVRQADISPLAYLQRQLSCGDRIVLNVLRQEGVTRSKKWWRFFGKEDRSIRIARQWKELREGNANSHSTIRVKRKQAQRNRVRIAT